MLLEIKDLSIDINLSGKSYPVLTDVSFNIEKGTILGFVGESGSGKSITTLSIMGLLDKSFNIKKGEIIIDGKNLLELDKINRRKMLGCEIAIIFQNPLNALNPLLTIYEQMAEMILIHNKKLSKIEVKKRVIKALEEVQLPNPQKDMYKYPHEFSGGQRQRILIAMAIINHPKLLIADEATTALDVTVQYKILKLLKSLCSKYGTTLIVISHNFGLIKYMSKEVIVMYSGRVVEDGFIDDIIKNPSHPYTKELLSSLPESAIKGEIIHTIKGRVPSIREEKTNCPFYPRCKYRKDICLKEPLKAVLVGENHWAYCLFAGEFDE